MSMSIVSAAVGSLPSVDRAFKTTFDRKFQVTAYSQRTYAFAEIFGHSGDIGGDGARIAVVEGYVHLQRHIAVVCILYCKESEGCIRYDDPTIHVDWGTLLNGIQPILSEKDETAPTLENCNANFIYKVNC